MQWIILLHVFSSSCKSLKQGTLKFCWRVALQWLQSRHRRHQVLSFGSSAVTIAATAALVLPPQSPTSPPRSFSQVALQTTMNSIISFSNGTKCRLTMHVVRLVTASLLQLAKQPASVCTVPLQSPRGSVQRQCCNCSAEYGWRYATLTPPFTAAASATRHGATTCRWRCNGDALAVAWRRIANAHCKHCREENHYVMRSSSLFFLPAMYEVIKDRLYS